MYHSLRSTRKRKRRLLKCTIIMLSLCILAAAAFLRPAAVQEELPADDWITTFQPAQPGPVTRREVYTEVLPAQTLYCRDISLPAGTERVLQPGMDGELRCTAEVTYQEGREIGRTVLRRDLLAQSVDRIVAIGTQEEVPIEIRNGSIYLPGGVELTYTHAITVQAGAYPKAEGCYPLTLTGSSPLRIGIAGVDPAFIPPGTRLFVTAADGSFPYGIARTVDGGLTGEGMELYFPTSAECMAFGQRTCTVYFLGE